SNIASLDPGLSRLRNAWSGPTATFSNDFPVGARDVRRFDTLQFRAGVDYTDTRAPVSSLTSLSVTLSDGSRSATVLTGADLGNHELFFPTGVYEPSTVMNTVRIPLNLFTGIDLADVRRLTLRYDQTPAATILVSDIAFADDAEASPPRCQTSESFVVGDRAKVTTPTGVAAIYNAGSGISQLGRNAIADGIVSVGNVEILERGVVRGDVVSSGTIHVLPTAVVTGVRSALRPVSLPAPPVLPAFPAASGMVNVNPGPAVSLAPGSRVSVNVNGGFLKLAAGDYFFRTLTINSNSRVEVTPRTRLFVLNALAVRSSFVSPGNTLESVLLGFAGTSDLPVEAAFQGTLVAPNARVILGTSSATSFSGAFFARIISLRNDATLVCNDGPGLGAPSAPTCSDGTRNGSETAVDCGGPICVDCLAGQGCTTASDCASGICANSICQPALGSVTATRTVTSDWPGGYCVSLLVRNNSTLPTSNFTVNLNTNQSTLYTSWNGTFSGSSGNLTARPSFTWNKVIAPGATDSSIGFCANRALWGSGILPTITSASGTF
ncbi:MAG TPA: cellulose binding domain-containing protein, partial [Polyangiaceae bacterium]|nr:cellulose binding domain-containing protein [Polyangiaceae bacterium]